VDRSLRKRLEAHFAERLTGPIRQRHDETEIRIHPADVTDVMRDLHDDPEFGFEILADLAGVDTGTDMQVVYHLWSPRTPDWLRIIAVGMPRDDPRVGHGRGRPFAPAVDLRDHAALGPAPERRRGDADALGGFRQGEGREGHPGVVSRP